MDTTILLPAPAEDESDGCCYQPYFIIQNGKQTTSTHFPRQMNKAPQKLPYFGTREEAVNYFKTKCKNASGVVKRFAKDFKGYKSRFCLGTTDLINASFTFEIDRPTKDIKYYYAR
jgi:hypothetical protein